MNRDRLDTLALILGLVGFILVLALLCAGLISR